MTSLIAILASVSVNLLFFSGLLFAKARTEARRAHGLDRIEASP